VRASQERRNCLSFDQHSSMGDKSRISHKQKKAD
jgi:hypothetical protein